MCWCEIGCSFLPLWMHVSLGCWGEISCFLVPHLDASVNQVPRWEWLFFSALSGCKCHSGAEVRLAVFFCPVWMQVSLRCWGEIGCSFLPHLEQLMQMSLRCWGGIACLSLPISECKCCWGALFDCSGSVLTISLAWQCSSRKGDLYQAGILWETALNPSKSLVLLCHFLPSGEVSLMRCACLCATDHAQILPQSLHLVACFLPSTWGNLGSQTEGDMIQFQSQSCDYMVCDQLLWETPNHDVTVEWLIV